MLRFVPEDRGGLWEFRGRTIIKEVLNDLETRYNINSPGNKILFSGGSAGGLGVVANIDFVRAQLSQVRASC
jgi:Pectinacetylesterase